MMPRIMLVDDDYTVKMALEASLITMGYDVIGQADSGEQAVEMARDLKPDVILMDIVMPGHMDGISAAEKIRSELDVAIVFLTGYGDPEYVERAKQVEPFGYVMKPWTDEEIWASVEIALYKKEIERKLKDSHEELNKLNLEMKTEIEERKKCDQELRESEKKYRSLFENSPIGIATLDKERNILDFNDAMLEINGYTREDMGTIANTSEYYYNPEDKIRVSSELSKNGFVNEMEVRFKRKDGTPYDALLSMKPMEIEGQSLWHAMIQDISNRKRAEDELQKSRREWEGIFQAIGHPTLILDNHHRLIHANAATKKATGKPETDLIGKRCYEIFHHTDGPPEGCPCEKMIASGHLETVEMEAEALGGSFLVSCTPMLDDKGRIEKVIHIATDITQSKRLEEQLRRTQKMEAVGTLTGGIAHDYNNLLSMIMGNLSMAQEETAPHSVMAEFLHEAEQASCKARDLTHQLMTLSRGGYPMKKLGSIEELLKEVPRQVQAHDSIEYTFAIQDDLWPVQYDSRQLHFAISNVLINAVEAMPQGGTITLQAENQVIGNKDKDSTLALNEGKYVRISIKDQGRGIPKEDTDKIFDPYFSTKERGVQKGMGLGLTTAYAVVQKHGGHIMVNSITGVRTTVTIYLPATAAESPGEIGSALHGAGKAPDAERDEMETQSSIANQQSLRGVGPYWPEAAIPRVLVMDDEEMLRNLGQKMLERLGYKVETVKDGVEAIETYKKHMNSGEPFDVVILDLTIKGGMGGVQTIKELIKIDPDVKAIVCSGYFNDPVLVNYEEHGFRGAMAKPYQKVDLERVLKKVL